MKLPKNNLILDLADGNHDTLSGKFLIASPHGFFNEFFNKSLIYLASHGKQGAIGLIVNNVVNRMSCKSLLKMLKDDKEVDDSMITVHIGGPVEPERGFILHSMDYERNLLFKLNDFLAVSSNADILKDIANGKGPVQSLFVIGYTGWEAGQLEKEIENNLWLVSEATPEIIFSEDNDVKWRLALQGLGINKGTFSSQYGRG